jgi:hypothetical protein
MRNLRRADQGTAFDDAVLFGEVPGRAPQNQRAVIQIVIGPNRNAGQPLTVNRQRFPNRPNVVNWRSQLRWLCGEGMMRAFVFALFVGSASAANAEHRVSG